MMTMWTRRKKTTPTNLHKKAVAAFLARPRKDYRSYKRLTAEQLEERMQALPVRPPIWSKLRRDQKACFIIGAENKRFFFLNDMGTGKTCLSIALARYFQKGGEAKCQLVLVPRRANKWEWAREIRKHSKKSTYCVLHGSSQEKWQKLQDNNALFFIDTYMGFVRMCCTLAPNKKGKNKLKPNRGLVQMAMHKFDGLIADESTMIQNQGRLPFRICRQLAKTSRTLLTLTGTPFGRDPTSLWAQMYVVDKGATLGETLGLFRAVFFKAKPNFWGGIDYKFDKNKEKLLHDVLANNSIRFTAEEADLPEEVAIKKYVSLPHEAHEYYNIARASLRKARGNYRESKNAFLRMRQISSGFLGFHDDNTGERAEFEFANNPKLDLLLSLIEAARPDRKIIVFTEFIHSGEKISRELDQLKIKHEHLYGKTKDPQQVLSKFEKDPKTRVVILNNSMGMGLNLQVASIGIYYESPVSVIMREQTRRRFVRQGSKHSRVFLYDLITRKTADETILNFHKQGGDLFKAIVEGKVKI